MTYREITQRLAILGARLGALEGMMLGVQALLGAEEITSAAAEARAEAQRRDEEALAAQIKAAREAGWLKPIKVSGLHSVVVGSEALPGGARHRLQATPEGIPPQVRGDYIGRQAGEEFEVKALDGTVLKVKIDEVYEVDEERRAEVEAAEKAKAEAEKAKAEAAEKAKAEAAEKAKAEAKPAKKKVRAATPPTPPEDAGK